MGNGAIIGIPGSADLVGQNAEEDGNVATIRQYYARIWNAQDIGALANFLDPSFTLHRNHVNVKGHTDMLIQIMITQMNFPDLTVGIEAVVAVKDMVACRLNIVYTDINSQQVTYKGINVCRLQNDLIVDSGVAYDPS